MHLFPQKSFADISSNQTYSLSIPYATIVQLNANVTDFGPILPSEYGVSDTTKHNIIVGNATGSDSYVMSNDPTAGAKEYRLDFAPKNGSTISITNGGTRALLTISNGTASVRINITNNAKTSYPRLGDTASVAFTRASATRLRIPINRNVRFNSVTKKAPLDMLMDLDESTVTIADKAGAISFDLTFTVVGLN